MRRSVLGGITAKIKQFNCCGKIETLISRSGVLNGEG